MPSPAIPEGPDPRRPAAAIGARRIARSQKMGQAPLPLPDAPRRQAHTPTRPMAQGHPA
jgi:hypothetical protein